MGKGGEKQGKVGISGERWRKSTILFTKWPAAAILDDRKSRSIAFLAISDQCTTFFFNLFTKWPPAAILDD